MCSRGDAKQIEERNPSNYILVIQYDSATSVVVSGERLTISLPVEQIGKFISTASKTPRKARARSTTSVDCSGDDVRRCRAVGVSVPSCAVVHQCYVCNAFNTFFSSSESPTVPQRAERLWRYAQFV